MNQRGFTLMELLLALAIFALMSAMAYSGLAAVLRAREDVNVALDRTQELQSAIYRIQTDLEQTVARSIRDQYGDAQPALLGDAQDGLSFTHNGWRNPLHEKRSSLQRVTYQLDDEDHLMRLHWRVLDRAQDSVPAETELLDDVKSVEWRYLNDDDKWIDRWPPPNLGASPQAGADTGTNASTNLPRAVELLLETKTQGETRHLFYIPRPNN